MAMYVYVRNGCGLYVDPFGLDCGSKQVDVGGKYTERVGCLSDVTYQNWKRTEWCWSCTGGRSAQMFTCEAYKRCWLCSWYTRPISPAYYCVGSGDTKDGCVKQGVSTATYGETSTTGRRRVSERYLSEDEQCRCREETMMNPTTIEQTEGEWPGKADAIEDWFRQGFIP
jgi:hypothetical protein